MAAFGSAVKAEPNVNKYRYNLGLALAKSGALQQSETELQEVLRRDPSDMNARRLLDKVQINLNLRAKR